MAASVSMPNLSTWALHWTGQFYAVRHESPAGLSYRIVEISPREAALAFAGQPEDMAPFRVVSGALTLAELEGAIKEMIQNGWRREL